MRVQKDRPTILGALLVLLVVFSGTKAFSAPGKRVTVQVDGMACPFCTYNVEKRIKTLDAVPASPNYEASVEKGQVSFDWKSDVPVDRSAIREQVRKAGFTPGTIDVKNGTEDRNQAKKKKAKQKTLSGTARLISDNDQTKVQFVASGSKNARTLVAATRVDRKLSFERLRRYLKEMNKKNDQKKNTSTKVKIRGTSIEGTSDHLRLYSWQPRDFKTMVVLRMDKLVCENCVARVTKQISKLNQVIHVEADVENDQALVWTGTAEPDMDAIRNAVTQAGFTVTHSHTLSVKEARDWEKK